MIEEYRNSPEMQRNPESIAHFFDSTLPWPITNLLAEQVPQQDLIQLWKNRTHSNPNFSHSERTREFFNAWSIHYWATHTYRPHLLCLDRFFPSSKAENDQSILWISFQPFLSLDFSNSTSTMDAARANLLLRNNPDLISLNLRFQRVGESPTDELRSFFYSLSVHPSLRSLDLSMNELGPFEAELLADALKSAPKLEKLNLRRNNLGAPGVRALKDAARRHPTLQKLDL